jgi:hypothetical protein
MHMPEVTVYKLQVLTESNRLTRGLELDEYDADAADAARYRFLCDDLDSDEFIAVIEDIVDSYV